MLTKVVIENFKSFNEKQVFNLIKTKSGVLESTNSVDDCLKGALIVGPNASGKSNIIKAIEKLLELLFRDNVSLTQLDSCLFSKKNNTHLEYEFKFDDNIITYLFEFDNNQSITNEVLILNNKTILERNELGGKIIINDKEITMDKLFSKRVLLLKRCYFTDLFNEVKPVCDMMEFLSNSIFLNASKREIQTFSNNRNMLYEITDKDLKNINKVFNELNIDLEISKSNGNKVNSSSSVMIKSQDYNKPIFFFKRKNIDITLPFDMESRGNQALLNTMVAILHSISKNSLLLIDEFSGYFHNELEELLVKYFFYHSNKSQLIFTSHSTNLLNTKLLRLDQIFAVELYDEKGSIIHRFSNENPRETQNLEKMYLDGKFGAIPLYSDDFIRK